MKTTTKPMQVFLFVLIAGRMVGENAAAVNFSVTTDSPPGEKKSATAAQFSRKAVVVYCDNTEPSIEFTARELQKTPGDIQTQAHLGQYYAAKIRGTVALGLFQRTGVSQFQKDAVARLKNALTAWLAYAKELDASYTNKLFISGQKTFDWFDETGPQPDITISEKG